MATKKKKGRPAVGIPPEQLVAERAHVRVASKLTHTSQFCVMVQKERRPGATGVCVSHAGQLPGTDPSSWIGVEHEDKLLTLYHPEELTVI